MPIKPQVFERGVYRHFVLHLRRRGTHPRVQATLRRMLADERGHLSWVKEWLERQMGARRDAIPTSANRRHASSTESRFIIGSPIPMNTAWSGRASLRKWSA